MNKILKTIVFSLLQISIVTSYDQLAKSCLVLSASNHFGNIFETDSCFDCTLESLKEITFYYTDNSIQGISFISKDGKIYSYIENSNHTKFYRMDLTNSYLIGVDIWCRSNGISGLDLQIYDQSKNNYYRSGIIGDKNGCHSYVNSSFIKAHYLKINLIRGCVNRRKSIYFQSLTLKYSFSQCSLFTAAQTTHIISSTEIFSTSISISSSSSMILVATSTTKSIIYSMETSSIFTLKPTETSKVQSTLSTSISAETSNTNIITMTPSIKNSSNFLFTTTVINKSSNSNVSLDNACIPKSMPLLYSFFFK